MSPRFAYVVLTILVQVGFRPAIPTTPDQVPFRPVIRTTLPRMTTRNEAARRHVRCAAPGRPLASGR